MAGTEPPAPALECVLYVSSAAKVLTDAELEQLLTSSRRRNEERRVTGALLFNDGSFFQYFEGPPEGVEDVYGYIRRSKLHEEIIELVRAPIAERQFPRWLMGFTSVPKSSSLLRLSNAGWHAAVRGMDGAHAKTEAVDLLLDFWRSHWNLVSNPWTTR